MSEDMILNAKAITGFLHICDTDGAVMKITEKGIYIRPGMEVDAAAQSVINALAGYVQQMFEQARNEALEEAANELDGWGDMYGDAAAAAIRALKEKDIV